MVKQPTVMDRLRRMFADQPPSEQAPAAPTEIVKYVIVNETPRGTAGSKNYAGYAAEEYLDTLTGTQRADIFDKMWRSDSQVKMLINAVCNVVKDAVFDINPPEGYVDEEWAQEDVELMKYILKDGLAGGWVQFVSEALGMIKHGHSVFEMIDRVEYNHPKFGTINCLKDLAWRSQRTIDRWNLDKHTGKLESITQVANGDLSVYVDIPAEFLVVFSLDREGANYEGVSMLRAIYGNWFRKNLYAKLNAIGIEKHAIPTAIATIPDAKENTPEFENLIAALEAYTSHENGYIVKPTGWEIDLHSNTYDPEKVENSIDAEDKRMAKAFIANFLELGMNGFGSQSLSVDLSDFFLSGLNHLGNMICDQINRIVIPRMVELNRGKRPAYPQMTQSGITDRFGKELAEVLEKMFQTKSIIPDDPLEIYLRKKLRLPEKSDKGQRDVQPAQPKPGDPSATPVLSERLRRARLRG